MISQPVSRVLSLLTGVKKSGKGFSAQCPAHPDKHQSLSVGEGEGGRVLFHCHSGCEYRAVLTALGLVERDLFPETNGRASSAAPRIIAAYDYRDEKSVLLYQVLRYQPKDFRQRRPGDNGGWEWNLNGVRRVLYRLPELKGRPAIFVTEGEKDTVRLWGLGLPATTNAGGAGKWRDEYAGQLTAAGVKRVAIIPDNDEPGEKHALDVARSCLRAGIRVRVLRLAGLPPKGDVSDWLDAGHPKDELLRLAKDATLSDADRPSDSDSGLPFISVGELLREPADAHSWLVDGLLIKGGLSMTAGKPKAGKSTFARNLCVAVVHDEPFLGRATVRSPVLYLGLEEKRDQVREHFRALGVDDDDPLYVFVDLPPADALERLRVSVEKHRPGLVVIDGLFRFVKAADSNNYAEIYAKLEPLLALARRSGAHVHLTHHEKKAAGECDGQDGVLGSTAIVGSVDLTLVIRRGKDSNRRTIQGTARYGQDLPESVLELDQSGRVTLAGSRDEVELAEAEARILAALDQAGEPLPEKDAGELVGIRTLVKGVRGQILGIGLRRLVIRGQVVREGGGKRGDPFLYSRPEGRENPHKDDSKNDLRNESPGARAPFQVPVGSKNPEPEKSEAPQGFIDSGFQVPVHRGENGNLNPEDIPSAVGSACGAAPKLPLPGQSGTPEEEVEWTS